MKKLVWILCYFVVFSVTFLNANTSDGCKTDIYFGNGVWNKQFSDDDCNEDGAALKNIIK